MFLTQAEAEAVDAQVARLEARTGVQVVAAVVGKSDSYAELPWTAFALGVVLSTCGVVVSDLARPEWVTGNAALVHALVILGVGAAAALLAVFVPPFARLFLRAARRDTEVRQYAESMFLRRELFDTRTRRSVLLLVSLFERRIEIVPDTGLHDRVGEDEWRSVAAAIAPSLREDEPGEALERGLSALEALLAEKGFTGTADGLNELPDRPIEEVGA